MVKLSWSGMPVVMVNALDWVVSVTPGIAPGVEAVTLTGMLTVPELTVVTTSPSASDVAVSGVGGVSVIPPTVVLNPNVTVFPLSGFPPVSNTLKRTCAASTPPVPFNEMLLGVADTNWIEPVAGVLITKVVEGDVTPAIEAVMTSVPAQPLSLYEPCATPPAVSAPLNTAFPALPQGEEKVTCSPSAMDTPPIDTATVMLVVPKGQSGAAPTPGTGAVTVTPALPTAKLIELVSAVVPT